MTEETPGGIGFDDLDVDFSEVNAKKEEPKAEATPVSGGGAVHVTVENPYRPYDEELKLRQAQGYATKEAVQTGVDGIAPYISRLGWWIGGAPPW